MPFYEITVEQVEIGTLTIEADSALDAAEDAIELVAAGEVEMVTDSEDVHVRMTEVSAPAGIYWSGGDRGHWVQ